MVPGVYWYYGFPRGPYRFDFFAFQPGRGGFADEPAESTTTVRGPDPAGLLAEVRVVAARYPDGHLLGARPAAAPGTGRLRPDRLFFSRGRRAGSSTASAAGHACPKPLPTSTPVLRLAAPHDPTPPHRYGTGRFQAISSSSALRKHQAEVACLRLDAHLPLARQTNFLAALDVLCQRCALEVLYYFDQPVLTQVNLMVFFANGRQGVGGRPLRYTDPAALETAVLVRLAAHDGQPNHLGDFADYPPARPSRRSHGRCRLYSVNCRALVPPAPYTRCLFASAILMQLPTDFDAQHF